jgi:hypothetical protein
MDAIYAPETSVNFYQITRSDVLKHIIFFRNLTVWITLTTRVPQIFKKSRSHLKILGAQNGNINIHTEVPQIFNNSRSHLKILGTQKGNINIHTDPQIWSATTQNLDAQVPSRHKFYNSGGKYTPHLTFTTYFRPHSSVPCTQKLNTGSYSETSSRTI